MVRPDHWEMTTTTLVGMAVILCNQGRHVKAMEKYQQVLPIYEKEYESDSVKRAELLHHIAVTLKNEGKSKEAMEKYKRCLAIQEKVLGINHATTIMTSDSIEELQR
uniref:Uncharacterized protein n=1 Tax=Chaetoceros debilis TaxID=122233 RepID=A0A6S8YE00_9STRA|mmetsp:Transcript_9177/g.13765  ORF Transcript_9177/g.13765 Transcript_9177/m.13765 type:complete len:107 (-) Transcript_9177:72-392(-)|eukprot:CAMPEP_0194103290 /NCGR_PEP_ID=MMETSP0150-20130528/3744_1 /TAXON_ID=122233 /ORGANISM="Chaetoceros debilis, Strain MM31A-1" /LENGTH=106 /DNA_ID=CAMNT_0038790477 /DNA_START=736 /DNA_END=1056 /DNA_ORIENTATION=+